MLCSSRALVFSPTLVPSFVLHPAAIRYIDLFSFLLLLFLQCALRGLVPFHFRTTKLQANDKSLYAQQQTLDEQSVEHGHVGALELCLCEVEGPQLEMWREGPGKRAELR